jgi:hypothetical protein
VGDEQFGEDSLRWWCEFNTSILAQEGRRRDKALTEDEADVRARLGSTGRKCDTVRRCDDVGRRKGDTEEGKGMRRC